MGRMSMLVVVAAALFTFAAGGCGKEDKSGKQSPKVTEARDKVKPPAPAPLTAEQKVAKLKECWAAYDAGDDAKLAACYTDDATSVSVDAIPPESATGGKAIVDMHAAYRIAMPDIKHDLALVLVSGNHMAVVAGSHGTNTGPMGPLPPTGKKVGELSAQHIEVNDQGKVVAEEFFIDASTIMGQLGVIPMPVRPVYELGSMGETQVVIATGDETEKQNLEIVQKEGEAFNSHDLDGMLEYYADDTVLRGVALPKDIAGKAELKKYFEAGLPAFPDVRFDAQWMFAAGDYVVGAGKNSATPKGMIDGLDGKKVDVTGKSFALTLLQIFRLEEGKIKERWVFENGLAYLVQMGLVPDPSKTTGAKPEQAGKGAE